MDSVFEYKPHQKVYLVIKRVLDIVFAIVAIVLLALPMAIIALVTALTSKGAAVFVQERLGKNEAPFKMYKFRSMKVGAPTLGADEMSIEQETDNVTKWGRLMRMTSLDELPQLFCILSGKMSFVGPRPCLSEEFDGPLIRGRRAQNPSGFTAKPGLTGLAQVKMRRDHDPVTKAKYDSEYARTMSLWLDIKIFFLTFAVIFHRNHK